MSRSSSNTSGQDMNPFPVVYPPTPPTPIHHPQSQDVSSKILQHIEIQTALYKEIYADVRSLESDKQKHLQIIDNWRVWGEKNDIAVRQNDERVKIQIARLEDKVRDLEAEKSRYRQEKADLINRHDAHVRSLTEERDVAAESTVASNLELSNQVTELQKELAKSKGEAAKYQEEANHSSNLELSTQAVELQQKLASYKNEVAKYQQEAAHAVEDAQIARKEKESLDQHIKALRDQLENQKSEVCKIKVENHKFRTERDEAVKEKDKAVRDARESERQCDNAISCANKLQDKLKQHKNDQQTISNLQKTISEQNRKIEGQNARVGEYKKEKNAQMAAMEAQKNTEIAGVEKLLNKSDDELDKTKDELEGVLKNLVGAREKLAAQRKVEEDLRQRHKRAVLRCFRLVSDAHRTRIMAARATARAETAEQELAQSKAEDDAIFHAWNEKRKRQREMKEEESEGGPRGKKQRT